MSIKNTVLDQFVTIAREQNKALSPLTDDLILLDSGLDSLCFAVLVVRLEEKLGFDPFNESDELVYPVTIADFVNLYEHHG
jgi:acyl carrier protein